MNGLWAVHVEGPDDVLAMPDQATAEQEAEGINRVWAVVRQDNPEMQNLSARVVPWPYSSEAHADALRERADEGAA